MLLATIFISLAISNFSFFVSTSVARMPSIDGFETATAKTYSDKADIVKVLSPIITGSDSDAQKVESIRKKMADTAKPLTDATIDPILDPASTAMPSSKEKLDAIQKYLTAGPNTTTTTAPK